jgi:Skp family chaperone for outer membrane proteins
MVLETITLLVVKEKLKYAWEIVKKYWQFFLGLSVGLIVLIVKRDSDSMRNTFKKFKDTSDKMRDRSLEIAAQEKEKIDDTISEFEDNIENATEEMKERDRVLDEKRKEIASDLLEKEKEERGTLASELQKEIDKI